MQSSPSRSWTLSRRSCSLFRPPHVPPPSSPLPQRPQQSLTMTANTRPSRVPMPHGLNGSSTTGHSPLPAGMRRAPDGNNTDVWSQSSFPDVPETDGEPRKEEDGADDWGYPDYCHVPKRGRNLSLAELAGPGIIWRDCPPAESESFIRQCIATGTWSMYSPAVGNKPFTYKQHNNKAREGPTSSPDSDPPSSLTEDRPRHAADCPFCPGNEASCPPVLYEVPNPAASGVVHTGDDEHKSDWLLRVVPNKFPYLSRDRRYVECGFFGLHPQVTGAGIQEVVVSHPHHNTCPALMRPSEVLSILETLQLRGQVAAEDSRVRYVALFENHGLISGGSLEHPHFQVVGLPVIPSVTLQRLDWARRFHDEQGSCVFCRVLQDELKDLEGDGTRVVFQNDSFVAFVPYAASRAYQMWIVPRRHSHSFLDATSEELHDLSEALHNCLYMLYHALGDPDYNVIVRTTPVKKNSTQWMHNHSRQRSRLKAGGISLEADWERSYHWHLDIVPHTSTWGGVACFDMVVHKQLPETMAAALISCPPPPHKTAPCEHQHRTAHQQAQTTARAIQEAVGTHINQGRARYGAGFVFTTGASSAAQVG
ncbi:unnamed protein product [Vitrella brassicaformis CCMP3155]|uniref:Galactose-1-phosphate uridyl transferase N-terminal domain-containing protein n=4 Tax=Vitrella brassicaformis TaxID=1169539 RepID=A0A0G4GDK4_VITBC|nr:unnamed protein product [Vitrella brassicaformis CCMP3155]|eukprot:CEM27488.1 unnamed protein product [Vitrella brassicaformis CCMP3155]